MNHDLGISIQQYSASAIGSSAQWLLDTLEQKNIRVHPSSAIARSIKELKAYRTLATGPESKSTLYFDSSAEVLSHMSPIFGADFVSKSLHIGQLAGLDVNHSRWKNIACGEPIVTRLAKSTKSRGEVWELILASLAATFSDSVRFAEPDVVCTFRGRKIGVAAKIVYAQKNLRRRIMEGIEQSRGQADATVVFVDIVQMLPVHQIYDTSRQGMFAANAEPIEWLARWAAHWIESELPLDNWARSLLTRADHPVGVAFFMPMVINIHDSGPMPIFYVPMPLMWGEGSIDYQFVTMLLRALGKVYGFAQDYGHS